MLAIITALIKLHFVHRLPYVGLICLSNNRSYQLLSVIWMLIYLVAVESAAIMTSSSCSFGSCLMVSGLRLSIESEHPCRLVFHLVRENTRADSTRSGRSTPSWHHQLPILLCHLHFLLPDSGLYSKWSDWFGWCITQEAPADYSKLKHPPSSGSECYSLSQRSCCLWVCSMIALLELEIDFGPSLTVYWIAFWGPESDELTDRLLLHSSCLSYSVDSSSSEWILNHSPPKFSFGHSPFGFGWVHPHFYRTSLFLIHRWWFASEHSPLIDWFDSSFERSWAPSSSPSQKWLLYPCSSQADSASAHWCSSGGLIPSASPAIFSQTIETSQAWESMFDPEVGPLCSSSWFDFQLSVAPFYHFEPVVASTSLSSPWLCLCLSLQTHWFDFWIVLSFFRSDSCYRGGLERIPLVDWRKRLGGPWRRILFLTVSHLRISWNRRSVAATMEGGFITQVA